MEPTVPKVTATQTSASAVALVLDQLTTKGLPARDVLAGAMYAIAVAVVMNRKNGLSNKELRNRFLAQGRAHLDIALHHIKAPQPKPAAG